MDITATVDTDFLKKWELEANNAILAEEKHKDLFKEVQANYKCTFSAGGSGQNTIRVSQWLLGEEKATCYIGATSKDSAEETLKAEAAKVGMQVAYFNEATIPTGTCAVLVTGHNRSMVTDLSAANTYNVKHLDDEKVWQHAKDASVIYITGFFYTVSTETVTRLATLAHESEDKTLAMNLSAPFLLQVPPFFSAFKETEPKVDVYFGNESEFTALAEAYGWTEEAKDLPKVLEKLAVMYDQGETKERMVVMTQGAEPTVIVKGSKAKGVTYNKAFPVIPVKAEEINDTNGCGDAFVGGFLAGLTKKESVEVCVEAGNYCANEVIKRLGCFYPEKPSWSFPKQE